MCKVVIVSILAIFGTYQGCSSQNVPLRGPPEVEKPLLLNSFLPAGMQVMAHLTDLMKYDVKPAPGLTTTTTIRPTQSHKPGVYSPKNPLGAAAYFSRGTSYQEYVQRLKNPDGFSYFDRYRYPLEQGPVAEESELNIQSVRSEKAKVFRSPTYINVLPDDLDLLGQGPSDLLKQVNRIDEYDFVDEDEQVRKFSENYDDFEGRNYVIGNKKPPPTRAYVTLLSLYDLLNKESKKLHLNKYGGYTQEILHVLAESSTGTSAAQLQTVLGKIVQRRDTKDQKILNSINTLLHDLEQLNSYINDALRYIPPLYFIA